MPTPAIVLPFATTCQALDDPSDHSLLRELRAGSSDAAERLYRRYAHRLLALSQKNLGHDLTRRFDPEDVLQSVFGSFFRQAREGAYEVPVGGDLWPLLLVIALNKVRAYGAHHRAARRDVSREVCHIDSDSQTNAVEQIETVDTQAEVRMTIEEIIGTLPPHYQRVVRWRLEGYDLDEIANMIGRSRRSVERIVQASRTSFLKQLPELNHGLPDHRCRDGS